MKKLFCTCIIPTVGRETLVRAVESVLSQSLREGGFEIIIVNDSGKSLPITNWQDVDNIHTLDTNQAERSAARNAGAVCARGEFLHFLDDDDWVTPDAYQYFYNLARSSDAKWLYGMTQLVDRQDHPLIQLRHNLHGNAFLQTMSGEWIPLQASLIARDIFFEVGGFNPLLAGPEDIDLLRRFSLKGELEETPNLVAYVGMGDEGSTTDRVRHPKYSRQAREAILDSPDCFSRMRTCANNSYWHGRMTRVYLTSTLWNIQQKRYFAAISRLAHSVACLANAMTKILDKDFWRAISKPYASATFARGIEESQRGAG
ncbi:MAG: hypothetical protein DCC56_13225 [Anaerolineae bacterium]|nr:MAG: hypothetical protein DCC56_13225 [Anaerolineae bacterium]WKZ42854.1 MAG: glycosyltransferase family A protein [Anaerolineales bacterium]